jgi:hypothetical protein
MARDLSLGMMGPDVEELQRRLNGLTFLFLPPLDEEGEFDSATFAAVLAFQQAVGLPPTAIADAATQKALFPGRTPPSDPDYQGFTPEQIDILKTDMARARQMADAVIDVLDLIPFLKRWPLPEGYLVKIEALKNIFSIGLPQDQSPSAAPAEKSDPGLTNLHTLRTNFQAIRSNLDQPFPKVFHAQGTPLPPNAGNFAAWSDTQPFGPTLHISWHYFESLFVPDGLRRSVTIIHERAHAVLRLHGHPNTGDRPRMRGAPHEGSEQIRNFQTASRNAYCYEWLTYSLQSDYDPKKFGSLITGNP